MKKQQSSLDRSLGMLTDNSINKIINDYEIRICTLEERILKLSKINKILFYYAKKYFGERSKQIVQKTIETA